MSEEQKTEETAVISTRTKLVIQKQLDDEAKLRGHTRSQALEQIIKLGLPRYLKTVPRKYERIDDAA